MTSLLLGCLWVLAAAGVAMLPFRAQFPPGIALLVAVPFLLGFIIWENGLLWGAVGLFAFVSMFRRPLGHMARWGLRRLRGGPGERDA